MPKPRSEFGAGVLACVGDINGILPGLTDRFNVMVVISALAQHVGSALHLLMRQGTCDARQARLLLQHIERAAFRNGATAVPPH